MSQSSCLEWLKKHPGWHPIAEVSQMLDLSLKRTAANLRMLSASGEVERRATKGSGETLEYRAIA